MKIFLNKPQEHWICDTIADEFTKQNPDICENYLPFATHIWLVASWCFKQQPVLNHLSAGRHKVLTSIHHIVPSKFGRKEKMDFEYLDSMTNVYHVPNFHTRDFIQKFTKLPIHVIPYWGNQENWRSLDNTKQELRKKLDLPQDKFLVFSAQRDTEGEGISKGVFYPKLEKGPDKFCDAVIKMSQTTHPNIHVVLAGWRRQYIMKRLTDAKIQFSYFELPKQEIINELYNACDLYLVTSRYEGGPQSLIEAGLTNLQCVSTPVGIAEKVLPLSAIHDDVTQAVPSIPNVEHLKLPHGMQPYIDLLKSL